MAGETHRPGVWKQSNKGHNTGRHRSKGAVDRENRGKVIGNGRVGKKIGKKGGIGKLVRRHQQGQLRQIAKDQVLARKREVGSVGNPPILVSIIPLANSQVDGVNSLIKNISSSMSDIDTAMVGGLLHMAVPRFKQRFCLSKPRWNSLHSVLDVAKVTDNLVFVLCPHTGMDGWGEKILSSILAQGISTDPTFVVGSLDEIPPKKHTEVKKLLVKALERKMPVDKVWSVEGDQEAVNLVRHLGSQKRKVVSRKGKRSHLLGEKVEYNHATESLAVTGYIRGGVLSADRLVHIPGMGDFQVDMVTSAGEPVKHNNNNKGDAEMEEVGRELAKAGEGRQELDIENEVDCMEGEQTWPTEEELKLAEFGEKKVRKKVPKGTSDYQAAWINAGEEYEDDENDSEEDEEEEMEGFSADEESEDDEQFEDAKEEFVDESETMTTVGDEDYDTKHVNFAEEVEQMEALKTARMEGLFPDEVDTPMDSTARIRFQKYRGLKSFRTSVWDRKENLPVDYSRIFQFENFDRTRRRVMSEEVAGVSIGSYVTVHIRGVGPHMVNDLTEKQGSLVVMSLYPHEHRMSVVNMVVRRSPLASEDPVKSKERLVFQLGWRRFAACPLFSQHTNGNKHKYERYYREGVVVMTTFAPITFPPAPVLVFKDSGDGRQSLLATGTLLSSDPNRVVIKRTVLSGNPFKVHKRMSTVRFMFFNREDIEWFKPIELRTKQGRRGHIKEGLGTHGHMKCMFDGQVSQQDTVLMNLYKRVFPKWNYDPYVPDNHPSSGAVVSRFEDDGNDEMETC